MFVKFRRPYFSKDAVHYPAGIVVEVPDDLKDVLPKDAEVVKLPKDIEELPSNAVIAKPGFGAQPEHMQALAEVGAAPTGLMVEATSEGPVSGAVVEDKNAKKGGEGTVQTSASKAGEPAKTSK